MPQEGLFHTDSIVFHVSKVSCIHTDSIKSFMYPDFRGPPAETAPSTLSLQPVLSATFTKSNCFVAKITNISVYSVCTSLIARYIKI